MVETIWIQIKTSVDTFCISVLVKSLLPQRKSELIKDVCGGYLDMEPRVSRHFGCNFIFSADNFNSNSGIGCDFVFGSKMFAQRIAIGTKTKGWDDLNFKSRTLLRPFVERFWIQTYPLLRQFEFGPRLLLKQFRLWI